MAIPDVSTNTIYEGELPNVDSMSEVNHVRVITATGSGSENVPIDEFTLPASQIKNGSSVVGATVDDALTQLNTAKAADNSVVHSTGNETVEGVKTFTDSTIVPNPTTSTQADNKGSRDAAIAAEATLRGNADADINSKLSATLPVADFYARWLADTGTQFDVDLAMQAYEKMKANDPNTVFVFMPHVASKIRTSGVNKYMNKVYSLKSAAYDAVQTTEATQPFVGGYIAPSEKIGLKYMAGQTQTGLMDFLDKNYSATSSWTLTSRLKVNNKGTARIYLGSAYIQFSSTAVSLHNGSVEMLSLTYNFDCGKAYTVSFQYDNGVGSIVVNSVNYTVPAASASIIFGQISYNSSFKFDGSIYSLVLQDGRKSAARSTSDHQILSTFFPDVETIGIGYQKWTTSNFDGIVAGDGTVIQEVQGATTDGNAELITNAADRDFSSDTGWWKKGNASVTISGGYANFSSGANYLYVSSFLTVGKVYRITVSIALYTSGFLNVRTGFASTRVGSSVGTYTVYHVATNSAFEFVATDGAFIGSIDNVSIKEVGASDSTNVYNYVYAATTGSAAVKDLAATKAAAGWCYYNNDPANGAVYGKMYNWYAVHLFVLYPPVRGMRVSSKLDFDQLVAANGGSTVAGVKLKAKFGLFDNAFATNESGFSAIAAGRRDESGGFWGMATDAQFLTSTETPSSTIYIYITVNTGTTFNLDARAKERMFPIRLLSNAPNVPDTSEIQTNWITTNFASGTANVDLTIPFGCIVDFVRVLSRTGITSMQGVLYTGAGVAKETLFSGATVVADTPIELNTRVNQSIQQTNGFVRFNGVKADTGGLMMIVVGLKRAYNTEQL